MRYRLARSGDVNQCYKISKEEDVNYWAKKDFRNSIRDKNAIFLVAEENKIITGYIVGYFSPTKRSDVMIHESKVALASRGKKIGTKLVEEFCKFAFRNGGKEIYALIDEKVKKFYIDSCKFEITGNWIEASRKK